MGMDSRRLSERKRQPGHDRTFLKSEVLLACLDTNAYEVEIKPRELRDVFGTNPDTGRKLGLEPEAMIKNFETGRKLFVEVKKQQESGNAHERACIHHTARFQQTLKERFNYDYHPYVTIFCEELASMGRYTTKFEKLIEPKHYHLWPRPYELKPLCKYIRGRCAAWLDP